MKKIPTLIALLFFCAHTFAQSAEKINNIKTIINANGSADLSVVVGTETIRKYSKNFLNVPEEFWIQLLNEFKEESINTYYIAFYDKNFTEDEIKALKDFYTSDLGKKLATTFAQIDKQKAELEYQLKTIMIGKIYEKIDKKGYKEKSIN